tara:strand:- start:4018 stop:4467 length:450 start_codon:yes stop_codon:yes gene_type:complete
MKITKVYTDGACSGNPGAGGWGVVIITDEIETYNGSEEKTTNNRMELKAAIMGISKSDVTTKVLLHTDSKYVRDGITSWISNWKKNNWITSSKKAVKNQDLWRELDRINTRFNVEWRWVKAHQDNLSEDSKYNNMADELARQGAMIWKD